MQFGSIFALLAAFLILAHGGDDQQDLGELITCQEDSPCTCDITEPSTITCDHVMFKDEEDLTTANLKLMDKSETYKVVKLTNNNIRSLIKKEIVPQLAKNVETLDFSNNWIVAIDEKAFDDFDKLKVLKLSYNKLQTDNMENVFTSKLGKHLDQLYLDHNKLETIPAGFFDKLTNLKKLVLDGNVNLDLTDKPFGRGLKNLEELSLDDCNLEDLPNGIFDKLPKLKRLSLRGNPFTKIPDAINKIKNLEILDLSETKITEMTENSLDNDHSIEQLIIQDLEYLTMIDDCAFCGLEKLKIIDFSDCKHLFSINDNAFGFKSNQKPPKLEEVHFDNCNLTTLYEDLANWEDLKKISIGGNPLNCDCNLKWLLENPHLQTFNGDTPTCAQPESLKDEPLNKVNDKVCPQAKINTRILSEPKKRTKCLSFVALVLAITFVVLVLVAIFGFIQYTRRRGRLTNVFYRPELPQLSYNKLPTNPDLMSENYTYSIQQEKA